MSDETISARIKSLFKTLIEDSRFASGKFKPFVPIISNLINGFIDQTSEQELRDGIGKLRKELIPWLLGEVRDENQNSE